MAIVVCISALLVAFALTMVYTASTMLATANQQVAQERCYQLAQSFSKVLETQLTQPAEGSTLPDSDFYYFVSREFMSNSYQEYDGTTEGATRYRYELTQVPADSLGEGYGTIEIELQKEATEDSLQEENPLKWDDEDYAHANFADMINDLRASEHRRYTLTVLVKATLDDMEYTYATEYDCIEQLEPQFYHNNTRIYGEEMGGEWHWFREDMSEYKGQEVSPAMDNTNPVTYVYSTDNGDVISRRFEKTTYDRNGQSSTEEGLEGGGEDEEP
jgi:hypothetical protein